MIKIGDIVKLKDCSLKGEVCSINDNNYVVNINNKNVTTTLDNLEKISEKNKSKKENEVTVNVLSKDEKIEFVPEIMVRHQTVEEALFNVDVFVKEALYNEVKTIKIIHGKHRWSFKEICS